MTPPIFFDSFNSLFYFLLQFPSRPPSDFDCRFVCVRPDRPDRPGRKAKPKMEKIEVFPCQ